jgi:hypothetical protein
MPTSNDTLKARLARYRQIKISVIGRFEEGLLDLNNGLARHSPCFPA